MAPAISSLQSSIPTIKSLYGQQLSTLQGQVDPLKQRYDAIISGLNNAGSQEVNQATLNLAQEYGKRGISTQSGVFNQNLAQTVNPIQNTYASQIAGVQGQENSDINQLQGQIALNPIQQQQALDQLNQAIAAIQTGGGQDAITNAIQQSQFQQQLALQQQQVTNALALQKAQADYYQAAATGKIVTSGAWE